MLWERRCHGALLSELEDGVRVAKKDYANHAEAMTDVIDYIVCFYNCERLHSKLCNRSPNAFD